MTNTTSDLPAAGWYPDPAGTPRSRWWDGQVWTEQYSEPAQPAYAAAPQQAQYPDQPYQPYQQTQYQPQQAYPAYAKAPALRAPEGTSPITVPILVFAFLPLLAIIATTINLSGAFDFLNPVDGLRGSLSPTSLIAFGFTSIAFALGVLLAILDYRALAAAGVPKPFHWAWVFFLLINVPVYMVGRSIIVRSRTGSGLMPMFINLGLYALNYVVAFILTFLAVSPFLN